MTTHETIEFDVLFVGGGPANLAGAIRLMQLAEEKGLELEVALIDKGATIGAHAISGAVMNPVAIAELFPDYLDQGFPVEQTMRGDGFFFLTNTSSYKIPLVPRQMHNAGFPIVSLSRVCRWLGDKAEALGINIFPGFDGEEILLADDGVTVIGVRTGDKGLDKDGKPKPNFEPGIDLLAKVTVLGEGARGSLMKSLAAETVIEALTADNTNRPALAQYSRRLEAGWAGAELREGRNFAQVLAKKGPIKWIHLAAQYISKGKGLADRLPSQDDATTLRPLQGKAETAAPADANAQPAQDDPAMVDKLTGVYLSGTLHREDQPSHVLIHDQRVCVEKCYPTYGSPCTRFCPGDVYEEGIA